jgi:hypothetical protein
MLTDEQLYTLAERMKVPLQRVCFKSELGEEPLVYNKSYIINLQDETDEDTGEDNGGSHWVCFQVNKYPNDKIEAVYMDSYGIGPPDDVKAFVKVGLPYTDKDIQGLYDSYCGWACLAFLHFINAGSIRSGDLYSDAEHFMAMFKNLNKEIGNDDAGHNEFVLKQFFKGAPKAAGLKLNF